MAIAFRSSTTLATGGARTTSTINMPAGVQAGDEVRIIVGVGATGASGLTITPPGTATLVTTVTYGDGSYTVRNSTYRYRVVGSGDPASFAFTHSSATTDGGALAYSGVDTTPDDATATTSNATGGTPATTTLTTVTANAMLVAVRGSWDGTAITPPAGYTERIDQLVTWVGESVKAATGATGAVSIPSGNGSSSPWSTIMMALRPSTGTTPIPPLLIMQTRRP